MAFEAKYIKFGLVRISDNRKEVRVYSSESSYQTIYVSEVVDRANWAGDVINVHLGNGQVRRYSSTSSYQTIY